MVEIVIWFLQQMEKKWYGFLWDRWPRRQKASLVYTLSQTVTRERTKQVFDNGNEHFDS